MHSCGCCWRPRYFLRIQPALNGLANQVALAALITYLIFMASLFVRY
ncbi:MAG: hypothetical protein U0Z44_03985 [Kouleothrix sp.]